MGDDQRPAEGDSRLRGTREPLQQATGVAYEPRDLAQCCRQSLAITVIN